MGDRYVEKSLNQSIGKPYLTVYTPGAPVREIHLDRPHYTIGREQDNDIVLPPLYVSRHHGRLDFKESAWFYTDLGSTNGTFHNGELLSPNKPVMLQDGDVLRIGNPDDPYGQTVTLTFRTGMPGPAPSGIPLPRGTVQLGTTLLKGRATILIGRDPKADIHLPAPTVSWHHARLYLMPDGYYVVDLGSTNGTFVNGLRITKPYLLRQGDIIQVGPYRLVYTLEALYQYASVGGMRLDGIRLVREVKKGKQIKRILEESSISILPREFVAFVGPSGAGKTTLMMALNGFNRADRGQVLVNGDDLYRHFELYRHLIGYVPQDDIIHRDLTVAEALRYAARLRLPQDTTSEEIEQRIDKVLTELGMQEQKNQVISSLSGGQRKRVNIAVELLADPGLIFLDEPTSGLDPALEKKMMYTLRNMADRGRTVILVTHATANINQCSLVCFLAQGRIVYFGPPNEALTFFGIKDGDFSDIYTLLDDPDPKEARRKAEEWERRFKNSKYYQHYVVNRLKEISQVQPRQAAPAVAKPPRVNPLFQYLVLTRRYINLVMRDRFLQMVLLLVMPIIAFFILLIAGPEWLVGNTLAEIEQKLATVERGSSESYFIAGKAQLLLLVLSLASTFLGLFGSAYEIVKERPIYLRERMIGVRLVPYVLSKLFVLGLFSFIQCLSFLLILSLKIRFPSEGVILPAPIEMYVTLVISVWSAIAMGLMISASVPNANPVIYIILIVLIFQLIFSGAFFELTPQMKPLSYLTLSRWVTEALGASCNVESLNQLSKTRFWPEPYEVSLEVEKPAEDWEPVTVVTTTQSLTVTCPGGLNLTIPISVPEVTVNEMVTVTEIVTHTVEPEPVDINSAAELYIDYSRSREHLFRVWFILLGYMVAFSAMAVLILRLRDRM